MKRNYFLFFSLLFLMFSACKNETKTQEPEVITAPTASQKIDEGTVEKVTFRKEQATTLFNHYLTLKNALVQTNAKDASNAALDVATSLSLFEDTKDAIAATKIIANTTDVEEQRSSFVVVSNRIETILEGMVTSGSFYKQYCPMAFGNKGAYWLSNSKDIRNPYFGDKMLKCGRIDKEIK